MNPQTSAYCHITFLQKKKKKTNKRKSRNNKLWDWVYIFKKNSTKTVGPITSSNSNGSLSKNLSLSTLTKAKITSLL